MKDETFITENGEFAVSAHKLECGVVTLDFRTQPRMDKMEYIGYGSLHFQLSQADARTLGTLLLEEGNKDYVPGGGK